MKNNYHAKGLGILLLIVLFGILPVGLIANADDSVYETLEVKLPYKHIYTTNDVNADSVFHYSISAEDDAPLPTEAADGVFNFDCASGSEEKDGDKSVFNLDGNLTFEFTKPGIYCYEVKADSETDGKKKNASYYTLNSDSVTLTFYVVNAAEKNKINLRMMTAQVDDVKLSEIVFETKYISPEKTTVSSEVSSSSAPSSHTSSKSSSASSVASKSNNTSSTVSSASADTTNSITQSALGRALKTGDESNKLFYVILMTLSAAIIFVIPVLSYKEDEKQ